MGILPPKMQENVHVNSMLRKGVAIAVDFCYLPAEDVVDLPMFLAMFRSVFLMAQYQQKSKIQF